MEIGPGLGIGEQDLGVALVATLEERAGVYERGVVVFLLERGERLRAVPGGQTLRLPAADEDQRERYDDEDAADGRQKGQPSDVLGLESHDRVTPRNRSRIVFQMM